MKFVSLKYIRKQQPGESLYEDCNFESVTAEQHKNEYIRDSFISGLQSNSIRQRLLENNTLDLVVRIGSEASGGTVVANSSHPRSKCPAKDVECFKCGRKGYFSKVCRSKVSNKQTSAAIS